MKARAYIAFFLFVSINWHIFWATLFPYLKLDPVSLLDLDLLSSTQHQKNKKRLERPLIELHSLSKKKLLSQKQSLSFGQRKLIVKKKTVSHIPLTSLAPQKGREIKIEKKSPFKKNQLDLKALGERYSIDPELIQTLDHLIPQSSGLDIRITTPDGIKKDKLNDLELKFYMFNLRLARSLISAAQSSLFDFSRQYPQINSQLLPPQRLSAVVTYTAKGTIERIQYMQTSSLRPIQWLFQDILERLRATNPPKELLIDNHLEITYILSIAEE